MFLNGELNVQLGGKGLNVTILTPFPMSTYGRSSVIYGEQRWAFIHFLKECWAYGLPSLPLLNSRLKVQYNSLSDLCGVHDGNNRILRM